MILFREREDVIKPCLRVKCISLFSFFHFQSTELSVFETNIRFVGGLLSAYALSGDKVGGKIN